MSEHLNIRDSKRKSMGILDDNQDVQLKHYQDCKYENNPIISLDTLNIKGGVKAVKTSYFYMNGESFEKGEYKESFFDDCGRIVREITTKYDLDAKTTTKRWKYEEDKLVLSEYINDSGSLKTDYIYLGNVFIGKKIRTEDSVKSFVHYLYGEDIVLEETYSDKGKIETRIKKAYNREGQQIETVLSFNFFDNHHRYTYEYDEYGRLYKSEKWDCDNKLMDSIEYKYNEQGYLTKSVNSITKLILDYRYTCDKSSNWIEKQIFNKGELQSFWKREIEY